MLKIGNNIRIGLIVLLTISIIVLSIDILDLFETKTKYFKLFIFINSFLCAIYFALRSRLDQALTFTLICMLYNPQYPINVNNPIWRILEIPVVCLFIHRMYFLLYENQIKKVEHDADVLDMYFKELEHTIATLSYHQITIYLIKKYPESASLNDDGISWIIKDLPDMEFSILREYYMMGRSSKGGVNAKVLHEYKNLEIHLNFNLTDDVKYTIIEGKAPNKPNRLARHIKTVLVSKYHYLVL